MTGWQSHGSAPDPGAASSPDGAASPARFRTGWSVLLCALLGSGLFFAVAWDDLRSAGAFERSSHRVGSTVVESDCWYLCKGGPVVSVAYTRHDGRSAVSRLDGVERRYRVGDRVDVVYSDAAGSTGDVVPAKTARPYRAAAVGFALAGAAGLLVALLAWLVPANLRRLDRRDAARAATSSNDGTGGRAG